MQKLQRERSPMRLIDIPQLTPGARKPAKRQSVASRRGSAQRVAIIGGGIHGMTIAQAMAGTGLQVTVVERNPELFRGSSAATHNRAHLGYHYPRCMATALECRSGFEYFRARYPQALFYPDESYYIIERDSKTDALAYEQFCRQLGLPYLKAWPGDSLLRRDRVTESFLVREPCFNLPLLASEIIAECQRDGVQFLTGWELIEAFRRDGLHKLVLFDGCRKQLLAADMVINATYAYTNNTVQSAGLRSDMNAYEFHTTEIVMVRSPRRNLPALTIMDGSFITIMPVAGRDDLMIVYDVVNSVHDPQRGELYQRPAALRSKWERMREHGLKYFPFFDELEYVQSLWGSRPIPLDDHRASRETRILSHQSAPGFFSVLEGKFISAPLVANRLVEELTRQGWIAPRS
jgi:glycine/D-amino acid oxidase-like deaminating enzyme